MQDRFFFSRSLPLLAVKFWSRFATAFVPFEMRDLRVFRLPGRLLRVCWPAPRRLQVPPLHGGCQRVQGPGRPCIAPGALSRRQLAHLCGSSGVADVLALVPALDMSSSKSVGKHGHGEPFQVVVGYRARDHWNGQSLASPGKWPVERRQYHDSNVWRDVSALFVSCATSVLLKKLALERSKAARLKRMAFRHSRPFRYGGLNLMDTHFSETPRIGQMLLLIASMSHCR